MIQHARDARGARLVVVGIEATGHFHQTLAAHLADVPGVTLRLLNPAAVTAVRDAQLNRRRKTDELDAAAIVSCYDAARARPATSMLLPPRRCGCCGTAARTSSTPELTSTTASTRRWTACGPG